MKNNKAIDSSSDLNRNITVYTNIDDGLIKIMETKLENILLKHKKAVESGSDWKTPLSLIIAIAAFFGAGNFSKDFLGIPKEYWGAGFIIILVGSFIWFLQSAYYSWKNRNESIESLLLKIKAGEK